MRVHGFRTLVQTEVTFDPLTIMLGKNGVGKTTILDVVQLIGKFARGGAERAFGPPPWSLGWQRTKGIGAFPTTDFDLSVTTPSERQYTYILKLVDRHNVAEVQEERLIRRSDNTTVTSLERGRSPHSGTILKPDRRLADDEEVPEVSSIFTSFSSYELNPANIERGCEQNVKYIGRNGFGVPAYLASLKDNEPERFAKMLSYLRKFRPETEDIRIWGNADELFWGLLDKSQKYPFPSVHLSWGDRQLVGLLCVLFSAPPGGTIAIEEIDRGFHSSRYGQIIEALAEAAYEGIAGAKPTQIIVTTHSPSFVNKLSDLVANIRLVTRKHDGATVVTPLEDALQSKLGSKGIPEQPLGEVWEMGLLEDTISEAMA